MFDLCIDGIHVFLACLPSATEHLELSSIGFLVYLVGIWPLWLLDFGGPEICDSGANVDWWIQRRVGLVRGGVWHVWLALWRNAPL